MAAGLDLLRLLAVFSFILIFLLIGDLKNILNRNGIEIFSFNMLHKSFIWNVLKPRVV